VCIVCWKRDLIPVSERMPTAFIAHAKVLASAMTCLFERPEVLDPTFDDELRAIWRWLTRTQSAHPYVHVCSTSTQNCFSTATFISTAHHHPIRSHKFHDAYSLPEPRRGQRALLSPWHT